MAGFYVSDLDGTLLNRDATLSESTRSGLARLLADGLVFSVASARSVISMQPLLSGLKLSLPVIEFNGAFISDLQTGRHEIVNALEPSVAREIFELFRRCSESLFVSTYDGAEDRLYYSETTNEGASYYVENRQKYNDPRLRCIQDVAGRLVEQVVCLTVIGKLEFLEELELVVRERFTGSVEIHLFENQYSPGWYWLTVHDSRATKDQAIEAIKTKYGFGGHELIVFGDQTNDIRMFRIATHAIAVANAHPEVKRHATHVVGSNEEDSVVRFIEEHYSANR